MEIHEILIMQRGNRRLAVANGLKSARAVIGAPHACSTRTAATPDIDPT